LFFILNEAETRWEIEKKKREGVVLVSSERGISEPERLVFFKKWVAKAFPGSCKGNKRGEFHNPPCVIRSMSGGGHGFVTYSGENMGIPIRGTRVPAKKELEGGGEGRFISRHLGAVLIEQNGRGG